MCTGAFKSSNNTSPCCGVMRTSSFPDGLVVDSADTCCTVCYNDKQCTGAAYIPGSNYCFPMVSWGGFNKIYSADNQEILFSPKGAYSDLESVL